MSAAFKHTCDTDMLKIIIQVKKKIKLGVSLSLAIQGTQDVSVHKHKPDSYGATSREDATK